MTGYCSMPGNITRKNFQVDRRFGDAEILSIKLIHAVQMYRDCPPWIIGTVNISAERE
jgi:hypothetical protein